MTLVSRITRLPIPIDPARGQSAVDRAGIADQVLADLVRGAAGCSPYLAGLIQREADWLADRLADASDWWLSAASCSCESGRISPMCRNTACAME